MARTTLDSLIGCTLRDSAGAEIGRVESFYVDDETGAPTWAAVADDGPGGHTLTPLAGAEYRPEDNSLCVSVDRELVRSAPHLDHGGRLDPEAERELLAHYGGGQRRGMTATGRQRVQPGPDEPMTYGRADAESMLRSEERMVVGTEREEVGSARLHKYVVEEEQTITVPTTHEEVRLEREPITGSGEHPEIGEEHREVTLHADRVRVDTETVPVERVRLAVDEVEDQQSVTGTVRKERVEAEGVDLDRSENDRDA